MNDAFNQYLRRGDDDGLRAIQSVAGPTTNISDSSGYLAPPELTSVVAEISAITSLREIAAVVQVESSSYDVLIDHDSAGWNNDHHNPQIDRISIPLHELSALPKSPQRLLDDETFDIQNWLSDAIGNKFGRAERESFVNGDGIDKPRGFLTNTTVDNANWEWGKLGEIWSRADMADSIIDLVYSLSACYRANAVFVMNSKSAQTLRNITDTDGRFLWSDGLSVGQPARLMGYPVEIVEEMPNISDGALAVAFGDFKSGYTIAERPDLRIIRDPFSAKPHVLFYATKRVGGDVSDFAAIKLLKFCG